MKTLESPETTIPFLRFKVGEIFARIEEVPVYDKKYKEGKVVKEHTTGKEFVRILNVKGFGRTLREAEIMAGLVKTT